MPCTITFILGTSRHQLPMSAVFYFELNTLPNTLESGCSGGTVPSDPEALIVDFGFEIQNVNGESFFFFFLNTACLRWVL